MKKHIIIAVWILCCCPAVIQAKEQLVLDLAQTIAIANDSSLETFRTQHMYLSGYWAYRSYRANRLPSLLLNITPAQYNRDITKRYDSQQDIDIYRTQQSYYAYAGLMIKQNLDITGGTFYLESNLMYMHNFGDNRSTQFASIPIRLGYSQNLIGYNPFKWERKIEPLKYERVKKELLYNMEKVAESATNHFFALAMAQAEYNLAKENLASTDTLYRIGQQRYKIAAISQADLLTLKLDKINAQNTLQNTESRLKRAMFSLASFLNIDKDTPIKLILPSRPQTIDIPMDKAMQCSKENSPLLLALKQNVLEAEQNVDKTKKESRFNANVNASIGFNQAADNFSKAYHNPMRQDLVAVSVSIPIVDWGVRKGKYNMAQNNLNVVKISAQQEQLSIEEEVIMTVNDFFIQQRLIASAGEALELSILAYNQTKQRFIIGKADINSLTLSLNRQQQAQRNYISAMQNYWLNYYKIRRLTLYDFTSLLSLSESFELKGGYISE